MNIIRILAIVAAMAAAGCSGNDRFGGAGGGPGPDGDLLVGSIDDPTSPAYFAEVVGDRVLFEVDQSTLTTEARATLDQQARWMLSNTDYVATIEGHADERGTTEYNIALGARRAAAVQEYLFGQGVASSRLTTISYGKERPLEVCSEEVCYAKNRRGVTVLRAASGV